MKKLILPILLLFTSPGVVLAQTNCQVTVSATSTSVCVGQQVTISALASAGFPSNQFFDFDQNSLPQGWSTTGGTNYNANTCGQSPSGTPYFWASTAGSGVPQIVTADFDVCSGGYIEFSMRYAVQGGSSPCEGPDLAHEGVSLQYSLNGGATWINIIYYSPGGYTLPANPGTTGSVATGNTPYTVWNTFNVPIPPAAISTSTRFRWVQTNSSGTCCDNWGLDDISVFAGPCLGANLEWSNGLSGVDNFSFTATADTFVTASLYDDFGNFLCSDDILVSVYPVFTGVNNVTICQGQSYDFGSGTAILTYTNAGSYPVTFQTIHGCDSVVTLNLTVTPPILDTADVTICDGDFYQFVNNQLTSAGTYLDTAQTAAGCDSIVTLNLSVNPIHVSDIYQTICPGDTFTFSGQDFPDVGVFPVVFTNIYGCDSTINVNIDHYPVYAGVKDTSICEGFVYNFGGQDFSVQGSYPINFQTIYGCDSVVTLNLIVFPVPLPFAGNDLVLCSDEIGNLGQVPDPAAVYQWINLNGLSDGSISNPTVSLSTLVPITETYIITADYSGCVRTDSVDVLFLPYPIPAIAPVSGQCFNNNEFSFNPGYEFLPGATFNWNFTNATPSSSSDQNPSGIQFNIPGIHDVSVTIGNQHCEASHTIPVTVYAHPVAALSAGPPSGCEPLTVVFTNTSNPAGTTAQWTFGNGQSSNGASPSTVYQTDGSYSVSIIATSPEGCADTTYYPNLITVHPLPVAGFGVNPWTAYQDDPFVEITDGSMGASSWTYDISSGGVYTTPNFVTSFYDTGFHYIHQVVTTAFGCTDEITHEISVKPATTMYVPNAFTPNADSFNSEFMPVGNTVRDYNMVIFDRWGQKVFESNDIFVGWTGKMKNGELYKQDTYVYKITYTDHRGIFHTLHGHVTLLR